MALAPVTERDALPLAQAIAGFGPWAQERYAVDPVKLAPRLTVQTDGARRYQMTCGGAVAGAVFVRWPWLAGPYLQLLAVLPEFQGMRLGSLVLAWLEAELAPEDSSLWLCVSTFNTRAQRFYEAHGYTRVAVLDNLSKPGIDEILMRKRRAA